MTSPEFDNTAADVYWSSTTSVSFPNLAWSVHFADGVGVFARKDGTSYVCAVRGGQ